MTRTHSKQFRRCGPHKQCAAHHQLSKRRRVPTTSHINGASRLESAGRSNGYGTAVAWRPAAAAAATCPSHTRATATGRPPARLVTPVDGVAWRRGAPAAPTHTRRQPRGGPRRPPPLPPPATRRVTAPTAAAPAPRPPPAAGGASHNPPPPAAVRPGVAVATGESRGHPRVGRVGEAPRAEAGVAPDGRVRQRHPARPSGRRDRSVRRPTALAGGLPEGLPDGRWSRPRRALGARHRRPMALPSTTSTTRYSVLGWAARQGHCQNCGETSGAARDNSPTG